MFRALTTIAILTAVAGCDPRPMTHAEALEFCHDKADAAAGPQGQVGVRSDATGVTPSLSISLSSSFLRGDDPQEVFDTCMNELSATGQILGETQ